MSLRYRDALYIVVLAEDRGDDERHRGKQQRGINISCRKTLTSHPRVPWHELQQPNRTARQEGSVQRRFGQTLHCGSQVSFRYIIRTSGKHVKRAIAALGSIAFCTEGKTWPSNAFSKIGLQRHHIQPQTFRNIAPTTRYPVFGPFGD
jgi:hypothetical protein